MYVKEELLKYLKVLYINDELSKTEKRFIEKYRHYIDKLKISTTERAFLEYKKDDYNRVIVFLKSSNDVYLLKKIKSLNINATIIVAVDKRSEPYLLDAIKLDVDRFIDITMNHDQIIKNAIKYVEIDLLKSKLFESYQYYNALTKFFIVSKTDERGNIKYVNDKFCEISGFTERELIGKSHRVIRHKEMKDEIFKDLWETILKKEAWQGIIKNRTKDGNFYIVDALILPLLDKDNNIKEFLSIRKDITEQENLKNKINYEKKEKEIAKEREKIKDSFLVLFTHELKTPLNAIINFNNYVISNIEKSTINKKEKLINLLTLSKDNASYMLTVVNNLLDVAKLKSNKVKFNYTNFNLNNSIKEVVNNYSSLIDKNGLDVILNFDAEIIIKSDELRVVQIISNIVSNAIKYGNKTILITLSKKNRGFLLSIADDGIGIKDKTRVFEMYEQDNTNLLKKEEGTGIGLYMVKLLCNNLKINYEVQDSKTLGGTNFILKAP